METAKRITRGFLIGIPVLIIALFAASTIDFGKATDLNDTTILQPTCQDLGVDTGCVTAQEQLQADGPLVETPWLAVVAALLLAYYLYRIGMDWKRTNDARDTMARHDRGHSP